jgi:hypothetical protein
MYEPVGGGVGGGSVRVVKKLILFFGLIIFRAVQCTGEEEVPALWILVHVKVVWLDNAIKSLSNN